MDYKRGIEGLMLKKFFEGDHKIDILLSLWLLFLSCWQFNNINNRTLDLVLSNIECLVSKEQLPLLPIDRHHPALSIVFRFSDIKHVKCDRIIRI